MQCIGMHPQTNAMAFLNELGRGGEIPCLILVVEEPLLVRADAVCELSDFGEVVVDVVGVVAEHEIDEGQI